jgi:glucan phosphoethanolaminetransferase (alkaline phosphatase superfamily)
MRKNSFPKNVLLFAFIVAVLTILFYYQKSVNYEEEYKEGFKQKSNNLILLVATGVAIVLFVVGLKFYSKRENVQKKIQSFLFDSSIHFQLNDYFLTLFLMNNILIMLVFSLFGLMLL